MMVIQVDPQHLFASSDWPTSLWMAVHSWGIQAGWVSRTKPKDSGIPWAGWFSYCLSIIFHFGQKFWIVLLRVLKDVWFHGTLLAISQLSKPGLNVCIPYKFGYSNFGSDGPTKELELTRHRNDILDSLLQTLKWPPWGLFVHGKSQTSAGKHVETCLGLSKTTEFPVNLAAQLNKPYLHIRFRIVDPDRFGQVLGCNRILGWPDSPFLPIKYLRI